MNTETRTSRDESAQVVGLRVAADRQASGYDHSKDKLLTDLKTVVADAERLILEAADSSAEKFATLRTRLATGLVETRAKIDQARIVIGEKAQHASDATHTYVKEHPWKSAGIFAAAGLILGILLRRR